VARVRRAFEEVGVVFLAEVGVAQALRDSPYRATIVGEADGSEASCMRKEFRSLRAAVHYYVLQLSAEERDCSHIVAADGKRWGRLELLALFKRNQ
jgi:hypothetical protein